MLDPPLDLPAVLVVRHLCLQRVHLRLHVEDPSFEFSEGLEQISGGVDEQLYPDQGILTLPELAQRFDTRPKAFGLAGDLVDTLPRALEGTFELVQCVPQRGRQVSGLILLGPRRSLLSCSGIPAMLFGTRPACQRRTGARSCSPGKFRRTSGENPNASTRWSRACAASRSVGNSPTRASRPWTRT
jgi:hypothetical protein